MELGSGELPVERALGVQWAIESDTFGFRIFLQDQALTRRDILSTISSVYVSLGIAEPFLLVKKSILQDLCCTKLSWDEEIGEEYVYVGRIGKASCLPLSVFLWSDVSSLQTLVQSSPDFRLL